MNPHDVDRRRFHQLALAALGGMVAGSTVGCGQPAAPVKAPSSTASTTPADGSTGAAEPSTPEELAITEPHVCRGLNTCKGLGKGGDNACAGQGTCASVAAHDCATQNACKGQGGCGSDPGMNACKGQGSCHVPLMDGAWTKAREAFEAGMKKAGMEFGAAPAKA